MRTVKSKEAALSFGIACVLLLGSGIMIERQGFSFGVTGIVLPWSHRSIGFSYAVPCFVAALVCGGFAAFYAYGPLSINKTLARWHFWLSFGAVLLCALAYVGLIFTWRLMLRHGDANYYSPAVVTISALGFLIGPPALVVGQLVFAVGVIQGFVKKKRATRL